MSAPATLGGYPVERELGRGGMGVVYLARDPRLNRPVAIKIVPEALAQNPDNLARFEREAKLLAAVSHPNIAAVYGVEDAGGQRLLVMEYVPGETLADRLAAGAMPLREALDVCRQVAAAMEAAHEGGIIHRDLKPGNIRITPDGTVKVLDFGLAKGTITSNADLAQSPTLTYSPTVAGVILGTAGYMSPEQARGKPVDRRADVWAFGCVLYECLSRHRAFGGETVSDTIARILEREPDWTTLPASTPARVRELLARCLEKDLKRRQRDMGDVRIELEDIAASRGQTSGVVTAPVASETPRRGVSGLVFSAWLVVGGAVLGAGLWSIVRPAPAAEAAAAHLSVAIPPALTIQGAHFGRDGSSVILRGTHKRADGSDEPEGRVFRRALAGFDFETVAGTEGLEMFVQSPDGRWLAVVKPVNEQSSDRRLWKISVDGSTPPSPITDWDARWTDLLWLSDGDILVQTDQQTKFIRIPSGGGSPKDAVAFQSAEPIGYPRLFTELPDGKVLMQSEGWTARGFQQDVWLLDTVSGKATRLIENAGSPRYVASLGLLFFSRGSAVMSASFDPRSATLGEPVAVFDGLRANSWESGFFSVAPQGHLLFQPGGRIGLDRRLVVVDASRTETAFIADSRSYESALHASPDGQRLAVTIPNARGTYETWVATRDRAGLRRVAAFPNADAADARFSPDGEWLAFARNGRDMEDGVYVQRADGSGTPRPILKIRSQDEGIGIVDWGPNGIAVGRIAGSKRELLLFPFTAGEPGSPRPLISRPGLSDAAISPHDGGLLAYVSDESGRAEISVVEVAAGAEKGAPVVVTSGGGSEPVWSRDGKQLYFRQNPARVMAVTIDRSPVLRASSARLVLDLKAAGLDVTNWDILPDGRVAGIKLGAGEGDVTSYSVILNWIDSIRSRVGR